MNAALVCLLIHVRPILIIDGLGGLVTGLSKCSKPCRDRWVGRRQVRGFRIETFAHTRRPRGKASTVLHCRDVRAHQQEFHGGECAVPIWRVIHKDNVVHPGHMALDLAGAFQTFFLGTVPGTDAMAMLKSIACSRPKGPETKWREPAPSPTRAKHQSSRQNHLLTRH